MVQYIYYTIIFTRKIFSFIYYLIFSYDLFFSALVSFFRISYKTVSVVMKSFSFCLSGLLFLSSSILTFTRYNILGCKFFPFSTLKTSCHSLLACRAFAEKSAGSLIWVPLYIACCFSLIALKNLYLIFWQYNYMPSSYSLG